MNCNEYTQAIIQLAPPPLQNVYERIFKLKYTDCPPYDQLIDAFYNESQRENNISSTNDEHARLFNRDEEEKKSSGNEESQVSPRHIVVKR